MQEPGFDGVGRADPHDRTENEAEVAVLALWRANSSAVREATEEARDEMVAVDALCMSYGGTEPVDEAELARAVEEIERAAAALRVDEPSSTTAVASEVAPRRRPWRVWLQIAGLWISIVAATVGMVVGLLVFMR